MPSAGTAIASLFLENNSLFKPKNSLFLLLGNSAEKARKHWTCEPTAQRNGPKLKNSLLLSLLAGNFKRRPVRPGLRPQPVRSPQVLLPRRKTCAEIRAKSCAKSSPKTNAKTCADRFRIASTPSAALPGRPQFNLAIAHTVSKLRFVLRLRIICVMKFAMGRSGIRPA
jgi:hypothetical protein